VWLAGEVGTGSDRRNRDRDTPPGLDQDVRWDVSGGGEPGMHGRRAHRTPVSVTPVACLVVRTEILAGQIPGVEHQPVQNR